MASAYIGRFAPSPTGPLHMGSLLAALVSFLDARSNKGQWHLRIDDIDTTRIVPGADKLIIECLTSHGLHWDGNIVYQTTQYPDYHTALERIAQSGQSYRCDCTRKRLGGKPYDNFCRDRVNVNSPYSIRFKTPPEPISFADYWLGQSSSQTDTSDAIIWRKDGLCAYQLAVVVDDAKLGVTHVIRGADIYDSTFQQIAIYKALNFALPKYGHFPVLVTEDNRKLSKQNHAKAVDTQFAADNLIQCLRWLGQPSAHHLTGVDDIIAYATENWDRNLLPQSNISLSQLGTQ